MKVQINLFLNVWIDVVSLFPLLRKYLPTGSTVGILAQGKNHQAYRLAESELGGGVLFDTTLPGLEPGILGCQSTALLPRAEEHLEVDQRLIHWATGSC